MMNIKYPIQWDEQDHFERPNKGWLTDVTVTLDNGSEHMVSFYEPTRLVQDLEAEIESGRSGIIEKGLLVIPKITKENIESVLKQAINEGYFE